ncbi:MAG: aminotransferase class V-fold PLP-dependent enzyme [Oleiphilaceae bacterium]|nr:aminotransferase class V-fold PLP-dependent enzyme [Oleiphilaceae bacterium]
MTRPQPIYLDYAATTPVDPRVVEVMLRFLGPDSLYANPASRSHVLGWQAEAAVEHARKQVAQALSADTREIVWTSGATEANNLAIKGAALALKEKGRHLITSLTEHKAVLDCFSWLETQGFEVSWLTPEPAGNISLTSVKQALRSDTVLVSLMHVNNETGAINPVCEISEYLAEQGVAFHIDAAQSAGKLALDTSVLKASLISLCAHKIYGPKGVGALYVRRTNDFDLVSQIHGGGHERGMRSGTLATHQIAAMGEALSIAQDVMEQEQAHLRKLKSVFLDQLAGRNVVINGALDASVPGILNMAFPGCDGQLLLSALPDLCLSSGSACTSATMAPSHVLTAMGVSESDALSALRVSFGRFSTEEEVVQAGQMLATVLDRLA